MVMKNKLYKHHKTKASFVVRHLGFTFMGLSLLVAVVALPTYLSIHQNEKVPTMAESEDDKKLDNNEEVSILSYNEE